jgi:hypothetical protein
VDSFSTGNSSFRPAKAETFVAANVVELVADAQATFWRRRHQPRRPPLTKIRPNGRPAPAIVVT